MRITSTRLLYCFAFLSLYLFIQPSVHAQTINTVAGGGSNSGVAPTVIGMSKPIAVTFDGSGNMYIVNNSDGTVYKVSGGVATLIAGGGTGTLTEGGQATDGPLNSPGGIAVDGSGNVYVSETGAHRICKIDPSGVITTFAGSQTGISGLTGDGGPATSALFKNPGALAWGSGNLYISDQGNRRIRKVDALENISTIAGTGTGPSSPDGTTATSATISLTLGIAVDGSGTVYFAETGNMIVRKITGGILTTVAGTAGQSGSTGDGGAATSAKLNTPTGICFDSHGDLYIATQADNKVRKVLLSSSQNISTYAGNGTSGFFGDGGAATSAEMALPGGIAVDGSDNVFVADQSNNRVREINAGTTNISTVAGNGTTFTGNGAAATTAILGRPATVCTDKNGNIYFPDNARVLKMDPSGVLTVVAGTGVDNFSGDGGQATNATIGQPLGLYVDPSGNLYIGTLDDHRIRMVDPSGIISTVAGDGNDGFSGDGGPATSARVGTVASITGDAAGNIYFADLGHSIVRKIDVSQNISTIAGTAETPGYDGDGNPAISAHLKSPNALTIDAAGNIYISDNGNNTVRKIDAGNGNISTVVGDGSGTPDNTGDGGPATAALFSDIEGVASDLNGNLYIVDAGNNRIRRVDAGTGVISAFAGDGNSGYSGDGGAAATAEFSSPTFIVMDKNSQLFLADAGNLVIRKITIDYTLPTSGTTITQVINAGDANVNDNNFHRLASVTPTGGTALNGSTSFQVTIDPSIQTFNSIPYLARHYDITPASNAATATANVTLYYLQSEFDDYNTYVTTHSLSVPLLPINSSDATGKANVSITQKHGTGTGTTPGDYTGTTELITAPALSVTWNPISNWWELTFPSNGFSGFFAMSGSTPLPLTLLSFTGTLQDGDVTLNWETTHESGTRNFIVERSQNQQAFAPVGTVAALNTAGTHDYSYVDKSVSAGTWYYRLKMQDIDGKYTYSTIVAITTQGSVHGLAVYPNPVRDRLFVQMSASRSRKVTIRITDLQGKVLQTQEVQLSRGVNAFSFSTSGLARGVYFISSSADSGEQPQVSRFVKQ